ncbi:MAG TPA: hypothetical protein VGG62_12200 [Terracidiphilus sp.]|jgi:hypothetical protein
MGAIRYAAKGNKGAAEADSLTEIVRECAWWLTPEFVVILKAVALSIPGVTPAVFARAEALYQQDMESPLVAGLMKKATRRNGNGR